MQPNAWKPVSVVENLDKAKNVIEHRFDPNFSFSHRLVRLVWILTWGCLAAWTPPQFGRWRRFLLRLFGARLHPTAQVRGGARIWYPPNLEMEAYSVLAGGVQCYNMAPIVIGENAVVSQRAFLCGGTHDYSKASFPLQVRPIRIGKNAWVASEAFVGPGVTIPDGCVIGARAVVSGVLEPWSVYAGNPAKKVKLRRFSAEI